MTFTSASVEEVFAVVKAVIAAKEAKAEAFASRDAGKFYKANIAYNKAQADRRKLQAALEAA